MNAIEQQILEKVSHLEAEQQKCVLEFVEGLVAPPRAILREAELLLKE